jgi:hypothetical protein
MSGTPNLNLAYLLAGQLQPEVTLNGDLNVLDSVLAGVGIVALTNANVTLTAAQAQNRILRLQGALTANVTVSLPASVALAWVVSNETSGAYTVTLQVVGGTSSVAVAQGSATIVYSNGTNVGAASGTGGGGFTNPMTTVGDLITGGTSGTPLRFGAPASGGVVFLSYTPGTGFAWVASTASVPVLPVNAQTGTTYTLAATDAPAANGYQGIVTMNNAAANVLTVPPNSAVAFAVGTQIQVTQLGAGQTSIAAGSGVTVNNPSSASARAQYSTLVLTQVAANVWVIGGDCT